MQCVCVCVCVLEGGARESEDRSGGWGSGRSWYWFRKLIISIYKDVWERWCGKTRLWQSEIYLLLLLLSRFQLCAEVMPDSVRPHRWQPTRLRRHWDSPGKNTGEGCYFLLQCMKLKSESEVTQSYPTLGDPMDCSLQGSSVHGIFQAGVQEWVALAFSRNISRLG